jgi:hypothetical protein
MKVRSILFLSALWVSSVSPAMASEDPLETGVYDSLAGSKCSLQVAYDRTNSTLMVVYMTSNSGGQLCDAAGKTLHLSKIREGVFSDVITLVIPAEYVTRCQPTPYIPRPCKADEYYDPRTGALIFQAGDVYSEKTTYTVLNPRAFKVRTEINFTRGTVVLSTPERRSDTLYTLRAR